MMRLLIFVGFAAGMLLAMRKIVGGPGATMPERCSAMCERMLASMPESFPPNRMTADLETLKERTARILELLEGREEVDGPQG